MEHPSYQRRTVQWGHWGITFMDVQRDRSKNFGEIVGYIYFPFALRGHADLPGREPYREMCRAWIEDGVKPVSQTWVSEPSTPKEDFGQ